MYDHNNFKISTLDLQAPPRREMNGKLEFGAGLQPQYVIARLMTGDEFKKAVTINGEQFSFHLLF